MQYSAFIHRTGLRLIVCAVITAAAIGCSNTRYRDLMRVTGECDVVIANETAIYNGADSIAKRKDARNEIIELRKKQMYMAQRINVNTMPEVADKSITRKEGETKKAELVAAARKRYEEACALPVPSAQPRQSAEK